MQDTSYVLVETLVKEIEIRSLVTTSLDMGVQGHWSIRVVKCVSFASLNEICELVEIGKSRGHCHKSQVRCQCIWIRTIEAMRIQDSMVSYLHEIYYSSQQRINEYIP